MSPDRRPCRVFISYAHESDEHSEQVRDLWIFLRSQGIDAKLDRTAAQRRQDWALWMADEIRAADHVLVIASAAYRTRAEGRSGPDEGRGVQWEARLIRDFLYANPHLLDRVLPVVLPGQSAAGVPDFLGPASSTVYHVTDFTLSGADALVRLLLDQPSEIEPPLGEKAVLAPRDHTLSLRHDVALHISAHPDGVRTQTLLAGTLLGEQSAPLPIRLDTWQAELDSLSGADRLILQGQGLWRALFDEPTGRRLVELIDRSPIGSVVDIVVHLDDDTAWLPAELLRLPDGRLAATVAGVRFSRRLVGVEATATGPLPGPLKILAAVAAPDETKTDSRPLDVESEMQALLDATAGLDAQVRILEVASLAEIGRALAADQYHVLHLLAHGSGHTIELEDEDGAPEVADAAALVDALKAGEKRLPLVVLSSCHGAEADLAASLVRHGADRVIAMQASVTHGFATNLARILYRHLAGNPAATVAKALAIARREVTNEARKRADAPRPEFAVPTLLCGGADLPLRDLSLPETPLSRPTVQTPGAGLRALPLGHLIGRRPQVRTAMAVLRGNDADRERFGDRSGVALTGIGGIGKTAVAGRILARAREQGWMIAEHVGVWNPAALIQSVADAVTDVAALRDPETTDAAKLSLVLQLLARGRLLVLFDDFEQNLTPDGEFSDPGFAEIFGAFCEAARVGRLLVTCRYPVPGAEDALLRIDLPALSGAELGRLLLRLPALSELPVEDRKIVVKTIGGHPRLIEFLDVLLRNGTVAKFRHVTAKLRDLATAEQVDLKAAGDLAAKVSDVIRLGSRDILLDSLLTEHLTEPQRELALQAALCRAPFSIADMAHTRCGAEPDSDQLRTVARDVDRLRDLTLLSATFDDELLMHPWVAASLDRLQGDELIARHERGAAMRIHRINNTGRGKFDDFVDHIRHLAGGRNHDHAFAATLEACGLVDGEVAVSALLAEAVPLIPVNHFGYIALAHRECEALQAIGLATATAQRLHHMLSVSEHRAAADPDDVHLRRNVVVCHSKLGDLAMTMGDITTAENHHLATLAITEQLAAANPENPMYRRDLVVCHNKLGERALARGDSSAAEQHVRASLPIAEELVAADPQDAGYKRNLNITHSITGDIAMAKGDSATASHHLRATLAITEELVAADGDNASHQRDLCVSHQRLGELALVTGDDKTAEHHFRTCAEITERLITKDPGNAYYRRDIAIIYNRLAVLADRRGDRTNAERNVRATHAIRERLVTIDPGNADYQRELSVSHNSLGHLARTANDHATAEHHFRTGLAMIEKLADADPANADRKYDLAVSHANLGDLAEAANDNETAEYRYRSSLAVRERLAAAADNNVDFQRLLMKIHAKLANLAAAKDDLTSAAHHCRTSITIAERLAAAYPDHGDYPDFLQYGQRLLDLIQKAQRHTQADKA